MNRRDFMRGLAAALAVPVLAKIPASQASVLPMEEGSYEGIRFISSFNPACDYGNAVQLNTDAPSAIEVAKELLYRDARAVLPSGTKFYVFEMPMGSAGTIDPYDEYCAVSWYYSPRPLSDERRARVIAEVIA